MIYIKDLIAPKMPTNNVELGRKMVAVTSDQ